MKIIVTGGLGFIGSALVWRLNEMGHDDILVVDRKDDVAKEKNLAPLRFTGFIDADEFVGRLSAHKNVDLILHMGACSSTTETDEEYMRCNNYEYTKDLAEFAVANEIRFIYASSAATYGDGTNGMADGTGSLDELRPLNLYGETKHLFDRYAARNNMFDSIVGLKYFNVFGPNENHKGDMRSVVNKAFGQINETGKLQLFRSHNPVYKDGAFGRDFVYVKDAVDMTLHFLDNDIGGLFNVGSGRVTTWNELAAATFAAMECEAKIEYVDMPDRLRDKYQYHTKADLTSLRGAGYDTETTLVEAAVTDYVQNYLVPDKHLGESS